MSNDQDELVDYGIDDEVPDHEMESVSAQAEKAGPDIDVADDVPLPTDNELRLAQRVLELERERDALAAQVQDLQTRYPAHSTPIPAPSAAPISGGPIPVPPELLPILALLRQHIAELTRDNAALRYTFLGPASAASTGAPLTLSRSGSGVTGVSAAGPGPGAAGTGMVFSPGSSMATTPLPAESPPPLDAASAAGGSTQPQVQDVDLAAVVERVRLLMLENDELGDMVAEAGRGGADEWLTTIEDFKAVIASLESDLAHNVTVIEGLRTELDTHKARATPLDTAKNAGGGFPRSASGTQHSGYRGGSDRGTNSGGDRGDRGGGRGGDRRRNGRGEDRYRPDHEGPARDRDRDRGQDHRDRRDTHTRDTRDHPRDVRDTRDNRDNRDARGKAQGDGRRDSRDHRDRDRDRDGHGRDPKEPAQRTVPGASGGGISILGRANADKENGNGLRRDDDRASKRRR